MDADDEVTLAALQDEFPAYRISWEPTHAGPRYIARSRHLSQSLHTLVTADPAELRAVLAAQEEQAPAPQIRSISPAGPHRRSA